MWKTIEAFVKDKKAESQAMVDAGEVWITKTGEVWGVHEMRDDHLINSLRMLEESIDALVEEGRDRKELESNPGLRKLRTEVKRRGLNPPIRTRELIATGDVVLMGNKGKGSSSEAVVEPMKPSDADRLWQETFG